MLERAEMVTGVSSLSRPSRISSMAISAVIIFAIEAVGSGVSAFSDSSTRLLEVSIMNAAV